MAEKASEPSRCKHNEPFISPGHFYQVQLIINVKCIRAETINQMKWFVNCQKILWQQFWWSVFAARAKTAYLINTYITSTMICKPAVWIRYGGYAFTYRLCTDTVMTNHPADQYIIGDAGCGVWALLTPFILADMSGSHWENNQM